MTQRLDNFKKNPFIDGPAEFLVKSLAEGIKAVPQFELIFGDFIDPYMRQDYAERNLPVLRCYNTNYTKEAESWFINGTVNLDVIFPASLRRTELQQLQDTISSALLQQFRRPSFFDAMLEEVPGLNELGKVFTVDKELGFKWADDIVPMTQITVNFRLDLRRWDDYLEETNRTKDDPFTRTLADLERIFTTIVGVDDATPPNTLVTILDQDKS